MNRASHYARWEREREAREEELALAPAAPTSREVFLSLAREALDEVEHALDDGETTDWLPLFLSLYEARKSVGRTP